MKNNSKKIILIGAILIIVAGMVTIFQEGFAYNFEYGNSEKIMLEFEQEKTVEDLNNIADEVFGDKKNNVEIEKNIVILTVKNSTEEEQQNLVNKINEKYACGTKVEDLEIMKVLRVNVANLISKYVIMEFTTIILITAYFMIKYRKKKTWKIAIYSVLSIISVQLLYFSIIAIARIPVSSLMMPVSVIVFIATIYFTGIFLEKQ